MVNFGKFSSVNTVIFNDFSPKMTTVRPKYVAWGSIQDGVAMTWIRYINNNNSLFTQTYLILEKRGLCVMKNRSLISFRGYCLFHLILAVPLWSFTEVY